MRASRLASGEHLSMRRYGIAVSASAHVSRHATIGVLHCTIGVPILLHMALVQALRALLVLLALLAIVPTQTGGALAVDDLGVTAADDAAASTLQERGHKQSPAKPSHHASFAAPDDGTPAGVLLPDWPPSPLSTLPRMTTESTIESAAGTRLERPPKSA